MPTAISKKRKFIADGVFFAELNEVLMRELVEDSYSGVKVCNMPMRTEIIIRATRTHNVIGERGKRIRELTSMIQKRFKFPENSVELYAEKVNNRGLCVVAQCESLRYKLVGGLAVRRACFSRVDFSIYAGRRLGDSPHHSLSDGTTPRYDIAAANHLVTQHSVRCYVDASFSKNRCTYAGVIRCSGKLH